MTESNTAFSRQSCSGLWAQCGRHPVNQAEAERQLPSCPAAFFPARQRMLRQGQPRTSDWLHRMSTRHSVLRPQKPSGSAAVTAEKCCAAYSVAWLRLAEGQRGVHVVSWVSLSDQPTDCEGEAEGAGGPCAAKPQRRQPGRDPRHRPTCEGCPTQEPGNRPPGARRRPTAGSACAAAQPRSSQTGWERRHLAARLHLLPTPGPAARPPPPRAAAAARGCAAAASAAGACARRGSPRACPMRSALRGSGCNGAAAIERRSAGSAASARRAQQPAQCRRLASRQEEQPTRKADALYWFGVGPAIDEAVSRLPSAH